MKNVKYYKDKGLEFVMGDHLAYEEGDANYGASYFAGACDAEYINRNDGTYPQRVVKEFAQRKNTGEMPSYKGLVYVEFIDGHTDNRFDEEHWDWSLRKEGINIIKSWKPVLVEEEQADNPEPNSWNNICAFMREHKDKIGSLGGNPEALIKGLIAKEYDIDMRSDKEKVVDDRMLIASAFCDYNHIDDFGKRAIRQAVELLYDAGMLRMPEGE